VRSGSLSKETPNEKQVSSAQKNRNLKGEMGMEMKCSMVKKYVSATLSVLAMVFFLTAAIPVQQAFSSDESIVASCFKGNSEEGNYIGDITVDKVIDAASDCNEGYEGCQGQCLGCVTDSSDVQACYDVNGEKITQ
jgi:hypothetical protein